MQNRFLGLAVAGLVFSMTGSAQIASSLKATVPFEFFAAGAKMPAGDYDFVPMFTGRMLLIRTADGKHSTRFHILARDGQKHDGVPALTFAQVGASNLLTKVADRAGVADVMQGRLDKDTEQALREAEKNSQTVTIAARRR